MAKETRVLNRTQQIMKENASLFMTENCELDVEQLATFGLDKGDLSEVTDETDLYLWALQEKDVWDGVPVRTSLYANV